MDVQANRTDGGPLSVILDDLPVSCPICHNSIQPSYTGFSAEVKVGIEVVFRCPAVSCRHLFIGAYQIAQKGDGRKHGALQACVPITAKIVHLSSFITTLSPQFEQIYQQALTAEASGLDQISGVGLRKALEFLIKDYCIKKHPDKAEQIKRQFLGNVIKDFLSDTNIGRCAERATWLGNDETHYVRKWEAHDITDLKKLIDLTVHWITQELETEQFMAEMPGSQPPH